MQQHRRQVRATWQKRIAEQTASGQSIALFCRERGIPAWQFFAWKKRLQPSAAPPFVAVQVVLALPPTPGRTIEVSLAGGRRLFVEPGFDPDHLRALVAALEAQA